MRKLKLTLLMVITMLVGGNAFGQLTFKTTSPSVTAYYEYLPADYNSNSNKYPVVIFLHGIGEKGPNTTDIATLQANIYKVAKLGPPMYVKNGTQFPFILIAPQLKDNYALWTSSYVMDVIKYVKTYLRIDERRIYLTGLSMGGGGTWATVQDNAKVFAAVAPVCGGYNTPKAINIANEDVPVWAFHGDKDTVVPMSKTVNMVNAINAYNPSPLAKLTIYAGVAHDAWKYAYKPDHTVHNPNVYEWLLKYTNTVNAGNKIPVVNAGADQTRTYSGTTSIAVSGSATDDGTMTYAWTKISGPTTTMTGTTSKTLTLTKFAKGVYIFRLKATDTAGNADSDYVKVTVN